MKNKKKMVLLCGGETVTVKGTVKNLPFIEGSLYT